jgi:hypothetical protein
MLGELDNVQPKPFKYLMEHKNIIKKYNFIQNLKDESAKTLKYTQKKP